MGSTFGKDVWKPNYEACLQVKNTADVQKKKKKVLIRAIGTDGELKRDGTGGSDDDDDDDGQVLQQGIRWVSFVGRDN